jgi:heat shock protein HslJ
MTKTRTLLGSLAALALATTMATSALAQDDKPEAVPIEGAEGITWQLVEQSIDGTMTALPDDVLVTLILEGGSAGGSGGCNSYFGSYTIDGPALTVGELGSTRMACAGVASEVETAYFANLALVASWANTGGSLLLADADGNAILNYVPAAMEPVGVIEGVTWLLTGQTVDGQLAPLPTGEGAAIIVSLLLEDGKAGGSGGCNNYFSSYELGDASLTFGPIGATQMFCEGAASEIEAAYFDNLALAASWASDGVTLSLADGSGAVVLEYQAAPEASILGGWVASGINIGSEAVVTSETTPLVTAIFDAEGSLTGFDGCNDYFTSYTLDGDRISISEEIGSTRMACQSDALLEQSQQYYAALVAATTWSVDAAGGLELRDDSGALQVSFTAAKG